MSDFQGAIDLLESEANRLEAYINKQSSAYAQIEDMGATMQRVGGLREAARILRSLRTTSGSLDATAFACTVDTSVRGASH